jgi:hypothetical protein
MQTINRKCQRIGADYVVVVFFGSQLGYYILHKRPTVVQYGFVEPCVFYQLFRIVLWNHAHLAEVMILTA